MTFTIEWLRRDLLLTWRGFRRAPGFVAGAVATFALAIGTTAAMFGLVVRLMLAPPPGISDADRVARVHLRLGDEGGGTAVMSTTSYPTFTTLRGLSNAFASVAATTPDSAMVGLSPDVTQASLLGATADYFSLLGVHPLLGRFFVADDDALPSGNSVIVLSHAYWQRSFAGDRTVLGRVIQLDGQPFTIVGIAPRGFTGDGLSPVDGFIPLSAALRKSGSGWIGDHHMNIVSIVVRLRPGITMDIARQQATAALRENESSTGRARSPAADLEPVVPGAASRTSPQAQIALWLAAIAAIVLLIAAANVGTLLSLRAARRRREMVMHLALGARSIDLARRMLSESLLLAALGASLGLLLSRWISDVVRTTLLPNMASTEALADRRVLVASLLGALVAGVLAGLAPLVRAGRMDPSMLLRSSFGRGAQGAHSTLVGLQVALCMMLLVGAALFVKSLQRVESQDLGFSTSRLLFVTLEYRAHISGADRDLAYIRAVDRLRTTPGVTGAAVTAGIPFGPHSIPPISVPGLAWPPSPTVQIPIMYGATPDYLRLMGVQLIAGRLLTADDRRGTPGVVLVNESMARTVWPGESALGKCVRAGFPAAFDLDLSDANPAEGLPCRQVVGVVRDSRARSLRADAAESHLMQYYVPFGQLPGPPVPGLGAVMGVVVGVLGNPDAAVATVQRSVQSIAGDGAFAKVRPYQDLIDPQLRSFRLGATLFSVFSILALGIAAVGLFGVISYVVAQRMPEIGIRLALGGAPADVARLVIAQALRMSGAGIAVGMVGALLTGPLVASLLFQTSARDPVGLLVAGAVLFATTLLASALPAVRAARGSPLSALRADGPAPF